MARYALFIFLAAMIAGCNRKKLSVPPCDEDLGYQGDHIHLANVRFLEENRSLDWFEIYDNIESRRENRPAARCIPLPEHTSTETAIERREHALRRLR